MSNTIAVLSIIISSIALLISVTTFWLTRVRRGNVRMTRPTLICFVPKSDKENAKIFLRTLLYSTSEKGQYIQNIFIQLQKDNLIKNFDLWAYGDNGIVKGSGLFVGKSGFESYHHFLLPTGNYYFSPGKYTIKILVETMDKGIKKVFEHILILNKLQSDNKTTIFFEWESERHIYNARFDTEKISLL